MQYKNTVKVDKLAQFQRSRVLLQSAKGQAGRHFSLQYFQNLFETTCFWVFHRPPQNLLSKEGKHYFSMYCLHNCKGPVCATFFLQERTLSAVKGSNL